MKKLSLNKRTVLFAGGTVLIFIIAFLSVSYAKYTQELNLPSTEDQSAQVATWKVGKDVEFDLFSSYYYGNTVQDKGDIGHSSSEPSDTVFTSTANKNVIAPGTKGKKAIKITDSKTEVSYRVEFTEVKVTFTGDVKAKDEDTEGILENSLRFSLQVDDKTPVAEKVSASDFEKKLSEQILYYNSANHSTFAHTLTISWEWPIGDGSTESASEIALARASTTPNVSVSFGTVKYYQIDDNNLPPPRR
ncbi:MAG: hypothetical protein LBS33_07955 [Streptococcaceae bacterium]|jgi:hypothetical protein|nr:hypothetical protein [Streptococcaceae bacterium]